MRGLLGNEIVPYFFISLDYTNPSVDDLNSRLGYYLYYVHRVANIRPIAISHLLYYLDQNEISLGGKAQNKDMRKKLGTLQFKMFEYRVFKL